MAQRVVWEIAYKANLVDMLGRMVRRCVKSGFHQIENSGGKSLWTVRASIIRRKRNDGRTVTKKMNDSQGCLGFTVREQLNKRRSILEF